MAELMTILLTLTLLNGDPIPPGGIHGACTDWWIDGQLDGVCVSVTYEQQQEWLTRGDDGETTPNETTDRPSA